MNKTALTVMVAFMAHSLGGYGTLTPRHRPTGGHRAKGYSVTQYDLDRIQAAAERRDIKAAKHHQDYQQCLANNPCLK